MSIAESRSVTHAPPWLHPMCADHVDPLHDLRLTVVAASDAALGDIRVRLERGPFASTTIDPTEYVNALRIFADHLEAYASDCDFAASLDGEV